MLTWMGDSTLSGRRRIELNEMDEGRKNSTATMGSISKARIRAIKRIEALAKHSLARLEIENSILLRSTACFEDPARGVHQKNDNIGVFEFLHSHSSLDEIRTE